MNRRTSLKVLIPDGEDFHSWNVAMCLAQVRGIKLYVLARNPWSPVRFSRYCVRFKTYRRTANVDDWFDIVTQTAKDRHIDVILPVTEVGARFASMRLDLLSEIAAVAPVPAPEVFDTVMDKRRLSELLVQHNIPHPKTIIPSLEVSLEDQIDDLVFPVMVKPALGSGGEGIQYCLDRKVLLDFFAKKKKERDQYVIQSFIEGSETGCSMLCRAGQVLAYTVQKETVASRSRFEPSWEIELVKAEETYEVVSRLLGSLKFEGVAHVDLIFDKHERRSKVIEINARYWNSLLGSLAGGINFPYLACLAALGEPFPVPEYHPVRFAVSRPVRQQLARTLFGRRENKPIIPETTSWRYMIRDPLPLLIRTAGIRWRNWRA